MRIVNDQRMKNFSQIDVCLDLFQLPSLPPRKLPPASIYSGYGEYGGQFFYYGNMSKYAYDYKFKHARPGNVENTSGELEQETNRPQFDLVIMVELRWSRDQS